MSDVFQETLSIKTKETKIVIENSEITGIMKSEDEETGFRVYSDNKIGVSSAVGRYDKNERFEKAKEMLAYNIPYDVPCESNKVRSLDLQNRSNLTCDNFIEAVSKILEKLRKDYPNFLYSGKPKYLETQTSLTNSAGTSLNYADEKIELNLLMKYKYTNNLLDLYYENITRKLSANLIHNDASKILESYDIKSDIEDSVLPVIFCSNSGRRGILSFFSGHLKGEEYGEGGSYFSDKLEQKLFGDDFSLFVDKNSEETYAPFFDGEGVILENDRYILIENGVIKAPYSCKMASKKYNYPLTSCASLDYAGFPVTQPPILSVKGADKTLKELLDGRVGIFIIGSGGGSFTACGEYSTPVQIAYLYDGEKIYGRLPQISVSSNVFDMFGKDFVGVATDSLYKNDHNKRVVINMKVNKTGGHT